MAVFSLTDNLSNNLNKIVNHYRNLAHIFNAYSKAFKATKDKGIAEFLEWESKERWDYADKLADWIIYYEGKLNYTGIPEPPKHGATIQALEHLVQLDYATVTTIKELMNSTEAGDGIYGRHLRELLYDAQHQYDETSTTLAKIKEVHKSPFEMMMFDSWLYDYYHEKLEHNPCE